MEEEFSSWLKVILGGKTEDFCVKILGQSDKGDGYFADIHFVSARQINSLSKEYNLVIKTSKRSEMLRKKTPMKEAFINEIHIFEQVFPAFNQFQLEKGLEVPLNRLSKCYGSLITENLEVILFENLKTNGFKLWGKEKPWTRDHINLVIDEFAKIHSASVALKDQKPEKFEKLCSGLTDMFELFTEMNDLKTMLGRSVDEVYSLLKGDLDDHIMESWRQLKEKIGFTFDEMPGKVDGFKVILHGDCWGNNFMFRHDDNNPNLPLEAIVIDWQFSRYSTPIFDLSYFLFAGISEEDIKDLDNILENYFLSLKKYTAKLGSDLDSVWTKDQFFSDWTKYCKFGILLASLVHKICTTAKQDVIELADAVETAGNVESAFIYEIKNKNAFRNRARHVVKYAVENHLIV